MNKNGFTLMELICVIVILGLLMVVVSTSAIKLSDRVKKKTYDAKIKLIEKSIEDFGNSNKNIISKGLRIDENQNHSCAFSYDNDKIVAVNYKINSYDELKDLNNNEYWCTRYTLLELANLDQLNFDKINTCSNCNEDDKKILNNVIINDTNNNIINLCYIYLYYKNNRVYSYFDLNECNKVENKILGHEFVR